MLAFSEMMVTMLMVEPDQAPFLAVADNVSEANRDEMEARHYLFSNSNVSNS